MLNKVFLQGRLGRDPELKHTQSGIAAASFSLAVDRDFKDKATGQRITDWIDVIAWRHTAEFVAKYFRKGSMVIVEGRLQVSSYTAKDGGKRYRTQVVADQVYFGGGKSEAKLESGGQTPSWVEDAAAAAEEDDGELPF